MDNLYPEDQDHYEEQVEEHDSAVRRKRPHRQATPFRTVFGIALFFTLSLTSGMFLLYKYFASPPGSFPEEVVVSIEGGKNLREVAELLRERGVIRSDWAFQAYMSLTGADRKVMSGDYYFSEKEDVFAVAQRLTEGEFRIRFERVTILEGSTIYDIAERFDGRLPYFNKHEFLRLAKEGEKEGYLFPDTYDLPMNTTASSVIAVMHENFLRRIAEVEGDIENSEFTLHEILTLASLIEREASNPKDRRLISGVLYNRLAIEMPLQVDVVFLYIMNKNSYQLTREDLRYDSPYNTYVHTGLPPGPIGNPSMDSIKAALHPTENPYLYFLADRRGNTYFAEDFQGHQRNRRLYLDS